jgi:hypothetical protein
MKRKIWKGFLLFYMVAVIPLLYSCVVSNHTDNGTIELINNSIVTVDGFYLAPVDQRSWGPNILSRLLFPGQQTSIVDINPGLYDAKVSASGAYSDYFGYLYDISIDAGGQFWLYVYNSSFTGSLEIRNGALSANIIAVYVVPADAPTWGANQTSSAIRPANLLHLTDFVPGLYDVRIVWNVGPDSVYYDVRINSLALTAINAS